MGSLSLLDPELAPTAPDTLWVSYGGRGGLPGIAREALSLSYGLQQRLFLLDWCACPPVPSLSCPAPSLGTGLILTLTVPGTQVS